MFENATVSGTNTVYTMGESKLVTDYGVIPESEKDAVFVMFDSEKKFVASKATWADASAYAASYFETNKGATLYMLMRDDHVCQAAPTKIASMNGTLVLDLGGKSLTRKWTLFEMGMDSGKESWVKNMVGAFYPPRAVLVDPETLSGLPRRQIANGLAESVKMALTFDEEFFRLFETGDPTEHLDKIIELSLIAKKRVVEEDEREAGLRRVLNFGHTLAHAIESESFEGPEPLYHGECVALGMIPMCAPEVRERLIPVLRAIGLPTEAKGDPARWAEAVTHDKKTAGDSITVVRVPRVGEFVMEKIPVSRFAEEVKGGMK